MAEAITRRRLLEQTGLAALGAAGIYGLVDAFAAAPARAAAGPRAVPAEQHVLRGLHVVTDNDVAVAVAPLHHEVVTAKLRLGRSKRELLEARGELEQALRRLDRAYAPTPSDLGVTVAWGRPYFREYVPVLADGRRYPDYFPLDNRASEAAGRRVSAFLDAIRFPSDPEEVILEQNDVCVQFRSDSLEHIAAGARAVFDSLRDVFTLTSVRKGFVGGGFGGRRSLPKRMAVEAGIPGAESIPETAQLFMGFTCSQKAGLGPERIANFETLPGLTDQWPNGYFRHGTTLHVSHLFEDLELWYGSATFFQRVWLAFSAGTAAEQLPETTQTLPQGPDDVDGLDQVLVLAQGGQGGLVGHSSAMQPVNRLQADTVDNYGARHVRGTAILQRPDFNTLDNPFFWTSRPKRDRYSARPAAGMHFLAYAPTSDTFRRVRLAMDGRYPDGTVIPIDPRSPDEGLNSMLQTTHRQSFLVPPRRHRSFPLAELL